MPDPNDGAPERFSTPRATLRQKVRPAHIRQRLEDMRFLGPRQQPLAERARLVLSQLVHAGRLLRESVQAPVATKPLFLAGHPRSGTGWIGGFLESHPDIAWGGELWLQYHRHGLPLAFMPKSVSTWHLDQNLRWQARRTHCQYSGAKLLLGQIANRHFDLEEIDRHWTDAKFIMLVRCRMGLQYVSAQIAQTTEQFALFDDVKRRSAEVTVDIADFRQWRDQRTRQLASLAASSLGARALWLVYEELDGNAAPAFDEAVWPFLGVPAVPPVSKFRKQRRRTLAERITNYDAVGAELEATVLAVETPGGRGYSYGPPAGLLI